MDGIASCVAGAVGLAGMGLAGWSVWVLQRALGRQAKALAALSLRKPYWLIERLPDGGVTRPDRMEGTPPQVFMPRDDVDGGDVVDPVDPDDQYRTVASRIQ